MGSDTLQTVKVEFVWTNFESAKKPFEDVHVVFFLTTDQNSSQYGKCNGHCKMAIRCYFNRHLTIVNCHFTIIDRALSYHGHGFLTVLNRL